MPALLLLSLPLSAAAADWPQWRGPDRNGISPETGLLKQWPKEGPPLLWKTADIGNGYSTPSVADGRVYVQSNRAAKEFALALDVKDGRQIWTTPIGKVGKNQGPQYPGTRSTPTIDGDRLYCLSSDGDLVCLERADGKERWKKNLKTDFEGAPGMWAYSESPLIDGDVLVCTPGGSKATLVALNKMTGDVIWKTALPSGDKAAYASAIIAHAGSIKQYIQFLHNGLVGVEAASGRLLWRYKKTTDMAANIPTPVFHDGYIFSSGSRTGGGLAKLTAEKDSVSAVPVYFVKAMANSIGGVVLVGDHLYGTTTTALVCMEFATGKVKWQGRCVAPGAVCYADGHIYVRGEKGDVALVEATPDGYKEKGRFKQPDHGRIQAWPHPIVANGCLYLRDQGHVFCYDIREKAAARNP
jgi:outer membrane protein assembly factor BamB